MNIFEKTASGWHCQCCDWFEGADLEARTEAAEAERDRLRAELFAVKAFAAERDRLRAELFAVKVFAAEMDDRLAAVLALCDATTEYIHEYLPAQTTHIPGVRAYQVRAAATGETP